MRTIAMALFLVATPIAFAVEKAPAGPETHTYKRVGPLEIKADVYRPAKAKGAVPVLVYIHGGSLINGGRQSLWRPEGILEQLLAAGVAVVSIDYRLAPESKLPAIVEDVEDAFRWIREKGPSLFAADPARIAVSGGSAGGYLVLVAGYRVKPRLAGIVSDSGYCDIIGPWQRRPSIHRPHYEDSNLSEAEAWRQVSGPPIANVRDRKGDGSAFNDFIRRTAGWPRAVTGWDPATESEKFLPYLPIRNVTADFPPTLFVHAERDSDVPAEQAKIMAAELSRHGVENEVLIVPRGEHGHKGAADGDVAAAHARIVAFVKEKLAVR